MIQGLLSGAGLIEPRLNEHRLINPRLSGPWLSGPGSSCHRYCGPGSLGLG